MRRWNEQWWLHDGNRYRPMNDEVMDARCRRWLNQEWMHWKRDKLVKFNAPDKAVGELIRSVRAEVLVDSERMPTWLGADFGADGEAVFADEPGGRAMELGDSGKAGLPKPADVLVFPSGIFDLRAFLDKRVRVLPPTERYFSATCLPFDLPREHLELVASSADDELDELLGRLCPVFMEFVNDISDGEEERVELIAQLFGYCLTPWTFIEVIFLWLGYRRGGKGTLYRRLESIVGRSNIGPGNWHLFTDKFFLHTLIGKNVCWIGDGDIGRTTDGIRASEAAKNISGNDPVFADRKHKDAIAEANLTCKIVAAGNRLPNLPDPGGALGSRFVVLPFTKTYAGKEKLQYKDQDVIDAEAPGVMLWALRGLRVLMARKRFTQPPLGKQMLEEYQAQSDPLGAFAEECLEQAADAFEYTDDLFATWEKWCNYKKRNANSHDWFCVQLRATFPGISKKQKRIDGVTRKNGYEGIRITERNPGAELINAAGSLPLPPH